MSYEPVVLRRAVARLKTRADHHAREIYLLKRELYAKAPKLAQLDADLRGTMADLAQLALSDTPEDELNRKIEEIKQRNLALQAQRTELMAQLGYGPDALDDTPVCPHCRDTGWVGATMCGCLRELCTQEQIKQLSSMLNLGEQTFEKVRLDVYSDQPWNGQRSPRENMQKVITVCTGYAQQFGKYPLKNLFFSGNTGLGKTFLSGCIAQEVSRSGHSVVYDTAINIFSQFEHRKFSRDPDLEQSARDETRRYLNCELLILDDLGSELISQLVQSSLYELINSRLTSGRHTIISSNLSIGDIRERYIPQIVSRLEGEYQELTFYGEDIRLMNL